MNNLKNFLLNCMSGNYHFIRYISNPNIIIKGNAIFEDDIETNHRNSIQFKRKYKENGKYTFQENQYNCKQSRIFLFSDLKLEILKSDQSLLHMFELKNSQSFSTSLSHTHLCGDDEYHIKINAVNSNYFNTQYSVIGKNKNYTINTSYSR